MTKKRVALLFGGRSAEHEVSVVSARNVAEAIDKDKYEIVPVGIDKEGRWYYSEKTKKLLQPKLHRTGAALAEPEEVPLNGEGRLAVIPGKNSTQFISIDGGKSLDKIDVVFPVLHGPYGEDGTMQGLLRQLNLPFVGPDVAGSVVGMDKDVMKRLFKEAAIPTADFLVYHIYDKAKIQFNEIKEKLGLPVFIKPANMGSSVGVSKAENEEELEKAVSEAFRYDKKIIIEERIKGREIECAVLGNDDPKASKAGEIIAAGGFYSYKAKYVDEKGATLEIPAQLAAEEIDQIQTLAVKVFKTLCCEGMGRVDMFLTDSGKIYVNEINTIPGFTKISMYPQLWNITGISYSQLIDKLLELAIKRWEREQKLSTHVE